MQKNKEKGEWAVDIQWAVHGSILFSTNRRRCHRYKVRCRRFHRYKVRSSDVASRRSRHMPMLDRSLLQDLQQKVISML
jgi:hypothetical protein